MGEEMREQSVVQDNMRIDWDVPIPMDDGIVLRADVFRPIPEGRYPVILTLGPYAKGLPFEWGYPDQWNQMITDFPEISEGTTNKYQNWEVVDPEKWVPEGYVCVRVDARGAGRSPGVLDPYSPRETKDLYNCIEWAGVQPWSNGKVGMNGISYLAMNQWHVACLQPPHLAAIVPWEGGPEYYREMGRHGGILSDFFRNWFKMQLITVQHGVGERGLVDPNNGLLVSGPETLTEEELAKNRVVPALQAIARPLDDEHYRSRSPDHSKITVPLLSCGNWGGQGLHLRGNTEGFTQSASKQKWLEIHGLQHWTHFYTDYGRNLQKRFLDHFLKGEDNGWDKEPPVLLNIRHVGEKFVLRKENEWPLARTQWTKLHLDPATRLLRWKPGGQESKISYEALSDGVTFLSPAFSEETEITGPVALKLFLSSSTVDADLFVTLRLYDPKGAEVTFIASVEPEAPLGQGWQRASHRKLDPKKTLDYRPYHSHDEIQLLVPGDVYEVDVEIWPVCVVASAGYRLGVTIQGKDFERPIPSGNFRNFVNPMRGSGPFTHIGDPQDRPREIFAGTQTLYGGGDRDAYLLIPIIPT